ncbi:CLUMA_CG021522, isoform A [Clunio marinus]|uniref:CLUMA_CG021522, isoform A n=1 Tax=Clunio marinus TaxID=568069 RepID=A0A1J1JA13_9DIPT|nr:CLUMA_CG021522, isoform A [Clunio marinus]
MSCQSFNKRLGKQVTEDRLRSICLPKKSTNAAKRLFISQLLKVFLMFHCDQIDFILRLNDVRKIAGKLSV